MIFELSTLYKRDTTGKIREWTIQYTRDGVMPAGYRTVAGVQGGKMVTSEWKLTEGKNIGKVNETTDGEQAWKEAVAKWEKKEDKEYFEDVNNIDSALKVVTRSVGLSYGEVGSRGHCWNHRFNRTSKGL